MIISTPNNFLGRRTAAFAFFVTAIFQLPGASSIEPSEGTPKLAPPHAEIPPGFWERDGLLVLLGVMVLTALLLALTWWLRRPRPPVIIPIEVQVRQELESLARQPQTGSTISAMSRQLRRYIVGAFDLPPQEWTTAELNRLMTVHAGIGPELASAMSQFLRDCDEQKFAPEALPRSDHAAKALALVEAGETRRAHLREAAERAKTPGA
jgi:hypothetical protein